MNGTILLADDSLTIQKVVELTFADTDHTVVTVSSGDELLEKLPSVRPDLVICDVLMPGTDGYAVCQSIKSDPQWLHIPVVLLTGTFEPFDRDRAIAAGCNEIITKPFEARKLVETVENLLQHGTAPAGTPDKAAESFEGAMPPPETAAQSFGDTAGEPYGTVLAPPAAGETYQEAPAAESTAPPAGEVPSEGLDFTTSGFDEMRAAGEAPEATPDTVPDEGLEFDAHGPDQAEPFTPQEQASEPFAPVTGEELGGQEAAFEFGGGDDAWSEPQAPEPEAPVESLARPATMPMEVGTFGEPTSGEQPFGESAPPAEGAGLQEPAVEAPPSQPVEAGEDYESPSTAPVAAPAEQEPQAPAQQVQPGPEEATATSPALSDEDVDRIARRVVELAADRLERIAWEVIPDMAELVIRERVRELEAEAEDTTH